MRIQINEIGQQQRQHIIETQQSRLLPLLQEASSSQGVNWLHEGKLPSHIRVYVNQQWVSDINNHVIEDNDIIDLISPMAGG